ncbi:MAG: ankyrin repeat domain-containing protein [Pyrinomonadaceae bacterium]
MYQSILILLLTFGLFSQVSCRPANINLPSQDEKNSSRTVLTAATIQDELFKAILSNDIEAVADALKKGADPNATYSDPAKGERLTPLALAVEKDAKIVQLLLEKGANPNTFSDFFVGSHRELRNFSPLMQAAAFGKIETVRLLIDNKADVNLVSKSGFSPLMAAASDKYIMELILKNGANPNSRDNQGETPLMAVVLGAAYDDSKMGRVKLLIEKGADPNAKDKNGRTALDIARAYADHMMIEFLQKYITTTAQSKGIGFVKSDRDFGCYMSPISDANKMASERRYYFLDNESGGIMNIDGEEVLLNRTRSYEIKQLKGKKRLVWMFNSQNTAVRFDLIVTKTANEGEAVFYDALMTVTKDGKKQSVKAKGFCGG